MDRQTSNVIVAIMVAILLIIGLTLGLSDVLDNSSKTHKDRGQIQLHEQAPIASTTTLVTLVPPDQVSGDLNDAVACPNCKP